MRDFCFCLIYVGDDDEPRVVGIVFKENVALMDDG